MKIRKITTRDNKIKKVESSNWILFMTSSCLFSTLSVTLKNPLYGVVAVLFSIRALTIALKNNRK
ncbi:hypothetical protein CAR_c01590 [Carnobacterium sp. 17-4]|uniref:hypothetical protein n=1 Tax=Carnobacterium sp. (strain 17-4) TaxID=208596 RepID=UPI0002058AAC|nr:hypothetical protein [Carnobacterium sp. 17-4]AEB28910.1 hypothetical protein CAR_c01590 [Carnobacterium sp. 17-4]